jgi:hypothetical protein
MDKTSLEQRARRRVAMKLGWWTHAGVYLLVNGGLWLAAQGLFGGAPRPSVAPLWGWALGLAIHGLVVLFKLRGDGLADRLVQAEVQRLRHLE